MPKIVSVHSFRGGTGKSNITANLATGVAQRGKRVGIVDTDIQSPGIHVLFGLNDDDVGVCLNDFLWDRAKIEETAHDVSSVALGPGGTDAGKLYLIPS